jgi:hypothetical protein
MGGQMLVGCAQFRCCVKPSVQSIKHALGGANDAKTRRSCVLPTCSRKCATTIESSVFGGSGGGGGGNGLSRSKLALIPVPVGAGMAGESYEPRPPSVNNQAGPTVPPMLGGE